MKHIKTKELTNGMREVTVQLSSNEILVPIKRNAYYQLPDALDDVLASHFLYEAVEVIWDSITQKWITT